MEDNSEGFYLLLFKIASLQLKRGEKILVKGVLDKHKEAIEGLVGAEPIVHASYYYAAAMYYQEMGPAEDFYQNALMFLAHSPYQELPEKERMDLAVNISLAALTGEGIFNFGEVVRK